MKRVICCFCVLHMFKKNITATYTKLSGHYAAM